MYQYNFLLAKFPVYIILKNQQLVVNSMKIVNSFLVRFFCMLHVKLYGILLKTPAGTYTILFSYAYYIMLSHSLYIFTIYLPGLYVE